jgi:antitoxin ParD1/3/4
MSKIDMDVEMSTNVYLTPELERFARECVAAGRYNNMSDVVRAALRLLQDWEQQRERFTASLSEAEAEADRDGWLTLEEVRAEAQAIIDAAGSEGSGDAVSPRTARA